MVSNIDANDITAKLRVGLGLYEKRKPIDPVELAKIAFPWPWAEYQETILRDLLKKDWRKKIILLAPRHRKTSIIAMFGALRVGENPDTRIMVASHTKDYSALLLQEMENIMRMPAFINSYGNILPDASSPGARWTTYERHIPNRSVYIKDPTFLALSPGSGTPGYGADVIVCFTGDTRVVTSDGLMPIKQVQVGDLVLTHNGNIKRVTKVYEHEYTGKMLSVKVQGYPDRIDMTPEHPVFGAARYRCRLRNYKNQTTHIKYCRPDCNINRKFSSVCTGWNNDFEFIPACNLDRHDFAAHPRNLTAIKPENNSNSYNWHDRSTNIDSSDFWWLIGLYLAEGCLTAHGVQIALNANEFDLKDKVQQIARNILSCSTSIAESKDASGITIIIHSSPLRDFVRQFYVKHDSGTMPSHKKFIPLGIIGWLDKEKSLALINGYISGDGCQLSCGNPGYRVVSTSIHLLWSVRQLCLKFGFPASICASSPASKTAGSIKGRSVKHVHTKYELRIAGWALNNASKTCSKVSFTDRYAGFPIQNIKEYEYCGKVYNLAVEDDNSYIVGACAVHNCDDIVSQANSATPTMRKHIQDWVDGSLLKRLEPDGQIVVIGARFYKEDFYGECLRRGWPSVIYEASPEKPLWPERWPADLLREKEREDPVFFPAQYLQKPRDTGAGVLDPSWLRYYVECPDLDRMSIFAGLDPAITGSGCKFSWAVVGRDSNGVCYLLDAYSGYHSDLEQPNLIDSMYDTWKPLAVAWESNGPQASVMHFVEQKITRPVNIVGVPSLTSKFLRLSSVAGLFRTGKLFLPGQFNESGEFDPATPAAASIKQAWGDFPSGDLDLLDALEKAVAIAVGGPPPAVARATNKMTTVKQLRGKLGGRPTYNRIFHGGDPNNKLRPED